MSLLQKGLIATFAVVALGLILTKPSGFSTDVGAASNAYATGVKALYAA